MKKKNDNNENINNENINNERNTEIEHVENQLKRALADYQNLEKRVASEKAVWIGMANRDLIKRLLPGLDSLLLAQSHTEDEGIKISIKQFLDAFKEEGIEKIATEGADFDPNLMEAVSTVEGEDGKVIQEVKSGYMLNGEVIRPAQVIVGMKGNN